VWSKTHHRRAYSASSTIDTIIAGGEGGTVLLGKKERGHQEWQRGGILSLCNRKTMEKYGRIENSVKAQSVRTEGKTFLRVVGGRRQRPEKRHHYEKDHQTTLTSKEALNSTQEQNKSGLQFSLGMLTVLREKEKTA